ncbi:replication factor C large subunit [Candidatus Thorarchaeota archaeon]|nr:MAG: replication factor C large subunit [Candidatus Thorarchaeota archaeon]
MQGFRRSKWRSPDHGTTCISWIGGNGLSPHESLPWPERYRPDSISQIVGNMSSVKRLRTWLETWRIRIPEKRAILLIGPPGVGKTASVGALVNDLDAELVEFNASDKRNKGAIERQVWRAATQQTIDGRMRIILLDEVDGLSGTSDRGGVRAILKVIDATVHPIVMTANDPDSPRLKNIKKRFEELEFRPIEHEDAIRVLKRILKDSGHDLGHDQLMLIIEQSAGDLRAAISDLEKIVKGGSTEKDLGLPIRNQRRKIDIALRKLFATRDSSLARKVVSETDANHDEILLWLDENMHHHLKTKNELSSGMESLSIADLNLGRIMKQQNWKLLAYVYDFLSVGVSTSRKKTAFRAVHYERPDWPLLVWRGNRTQDKRAKTMARLSQLSGVSQKRVGRTHQEVIGRIVEREPGMKAEFADWLNVSRRDIDKMKRH